MPLFSVIIPNYNHGRFLTQRINSVLQQTCTDLELIILDDCSTDNSAAVIEKYKDHPLVSKVIYNHTNSGSPFMQWKKGIELAQAEWIWIAESDDYTDNNFLATAEVAIRQDPDMALFYTDANMVDEMGSPSGAGKFSLIKNSFFATGKWSNAYQQKGTDELNEYLQLICAVNNAGSAVMNKQRLQTLMMELMKYKYHGDWFCYVSLATKGNFTYSPRALNTVRIHKESQLNRNRSQSRSKQEHFRILLFLLQQKEIKDKKKITRFFCEQYINVSIKDNGFGNSIGILLSYFGMNFSIACKVLIEIVRIKLTRRKVKPVF